MSEKVRLGLSEAWNGLSEAWNGLVGNVWRERTVDFLTTAFGEGYLTAEQHGERTAMALAAKTMDELRAAVALLPTEIFKAEAEEAGPFVSRAPAVVRMLRGLWLLALGAEITMLCVYGTGEAICTGAPGAVQGVILSGGFLLTLVNLAAFCEFGY